jgi:hypothetical protein
MYKLILSVCLALISLSAMADCTDLKARIDKKLQAKGVKSYTLDIVLAENVDAALVASAKAAKKAQAASPTAKPGKVVGTCEGGTKRIIYTRH